MNKEYILENVAELSASQLADCITSGTVTLDELRKTGLLDGSKRIKIKKSLNDLELIKKEDEDKKIKADDEAWGTVANTSDLAILTKWVNENNNNINIDKARSLQEVLIANITDNTVNKRKVLDSITKNPNAYSPYEVKEYLDKGTFSEDELKSSGIPQDAIDNLENIYAPNLNLGVTPDNIPDGYSEVYFWGGTGSGKTCALGAVLQVAEKKGYLNIAQGTGFNYATQLKNIFNEDGRADDYLPAPSPLETTQYLPFTLKKENERKSRSISLIELSGEIFKLFYLKNSGIPFPTGTHENTFDKLNTFLKSENRKVHFFIIDYDRINRRDKDGLKQSDYLSAASTYFANNDIFGSTTDAIYVILTKSDLLIDENQKPVLQKERVEYAKKYLNNNYKSFVNTLKGICKDHSINGGKLTVEPFSLGNVYFKEICDFNGSSASNIVDILMDRIPKAKKSILDIFNK